MNLTFTEELLLMVLDDTSGLIRPMPDYAFEYALAGAQLAELEFAGLVHFESENVRVIEGNLAGFPLQQLLLNTLQQSQRKDLESALALLAKHAKDIELAALEQLVAKGVLKRDQTRFLWVFQRRCYPPVDGCHEREVTQRIRARVMDPDSTERSYSDLILIALMDVCQLNYLVFSEQELMQYLPRIKDLAQRDVIGKNMAAIVSQIQTALLDTGLIHLR